MNKTKPTSIRLTEDVKNKLDDLVKHYNIQQTENNDNDRVIPKKLNRSDIISMLIEEEYKVINF